MAGSELVQRGDNKACVRMGGAWRGLEGLESGVVADSSRGFWASETWAALCSQQPARVTL